MAWSSQGWRRAAILNTIGVFVFTALAIGLLSWSSSRSGGVEANFIFFKGACSTGNSLNLWLHLLLNVFSTGVLASSNFFMQVLSSPSRSEVDAAHKKRVALEIGVPSFKNLFSVSKFKMIAWFLFFGSSIPIHLFFNSAIFSTEYQGATWNLTIASESFVNGAQYYPPGAMLWPAGGFQSVDHVRANEGYGYVETMESYFDPDSSISASISFAAQSARTWKRIEVPECLSQYQYCSARAKYGDVVMVVQSRDLDAGFMVSRNDSRGWTRDSVIASMTTSEETFWDAHVPAAGLNSLWFAANCSTTSDLNPRTHRAEGCFQTCNAAYGQKDSGFGFLSADKIPEDYTFEFFINLAMSSNADLHWPGVSDPDASMLNLEYCLAQDIHPDCKVGLANKLLLIVTICIAIKSLLCIGVVIVLPREDPLVVPGDAIASFITSPDDTTAWWATLDRSLAGKAFSSSQQAMMPQPREWHERSRRWFDAIPPAFWVLDYTLFAAVIIFLGCMFGAAQSSNPIGTSKQSLEHSANNGILNTQGSTAGQLLPSVLTANLPQLLLSFSYFVYNSLYTRLCVEKEWNSYSLSHRALRVTSPQGQQRSTYRLQLPYRYSVPLIAISILLHWLVSNALYVFVLEGGYYWVDFSWNVVSQKDVSLGVGTGLSDDAYVGIGYSTMALLVLFVIAFVLATIPLLLCIKHKRGSMVVGGSNSFVISAACHVPPLEKSVTPLSVSLVGNDGNQTTESGYLRGASSTEFVMASAPRESEAGSMEMQGLLSSRTNLTTSNTLSELECTAVGSSSSEALDLKDISQGLVRWGAVKMPLFFYQHYVDMDALVGHLSFGAKEHGVEEPEAGHLYI